MTTNSRKTTLFAVLYAMWMTSSAFAQDAMPGMDMSSTPQTAPEAITPAKAAKKTKAKPSTPHAHIVPGMDMTSMPGMAMPSMPDAHQAKRQPPPPAVIGEAQRLDAGQQIGVRPVVRGLGLESMGGDAMQGMPPMQGGSAPPDARSPDYSDGNGYGSMTGMDMRDDAMQSMLLIDRLETFNGRDANGMALDAQAWYGNDRNKLWLKADGESSGGRLQDLRTEALWDHAFATYWDTQLGVRHDVGVGPDRSWAAFGVQGLAPYWFDIEATAYVGPSGRTAARFEAEYDLRLTQRLILQPDLEINLYGRDDPQRHLGSGVSDVNVGVRLRYEFHRQFVPYIGIDLVRKFGRTADYARAAGEGAYDPQWVAGIRIWF